MTPDPSNGYDALAMEYALRRSPEIGTSTVRLWARRVGAGRSVLDLGCGTGIPVSRALADEGVLVHGIDASPRMIEAFTANLPGVPARDEAVETSDFFGRTFDGVVAWGLLFLLDAPAQRTIIGKVATALAGGGRFLFTAPAEPCAWDDVLTGERSRSLGRAAYIAALAGAGLTLIAEEDDEGGNHYYEAVRGGAVGR